MKVKTIKILMGTLIVIALGGLIVFYLFSEETKIPPDRPANVPITAIWVGGVDGGTWIDVKKIPNSRNKFRCKLFAEATGILCYEGDYILNSEEELSKASLEKLMNCITGDKILLSNGHYLETSDHK